MSKPKVIVFTTSYHPFIGGAEVAIQEIARRLSNRFDFFILTSRFKRSLPRREIYNGTTIIRAGFGFKFDQYFFLPIWSLYYTIRFYRDRPILFGLDISQGSLIASVLKLFFPRLPFVFNIQYGYGEERIEKGRFGIMKLAFRFMLSHADFVTAISTYLLNFARNYGYQGQAEVIHNGVDLRNFQFSIFNFQKRKNTIITTSRLVSKNGIDTLIKAVAEVKKNIPDIKCHIIGDGPERERLELQATSYKLQANIKFFGAVPYQEIPKYLHEADVFVRPSRSEGMGNSFVEALAAGLPIIGTPVGGITDIIREGKTGFLVNPEDSSGLASRIISILNGQHPMLTMMENGRRLVEERFSWDKISEKYGKLFNDYYYRGEASIVEVSPLRILTATPLYPPQLGGPATYAKNLSEEFIKQGNKVKVLNFGPFLKYPSGLRHVIYFLKVFYNAPFYDLVFCLDYFSVGVPARVAAFIWRKPFILRLEGDFLWENFVEKNRKEITLREFYKNPPFQTFKDRILRKASFWVIKSANAVVFSSEWRRKMILNLLKLNPPTFFKRWKSKTVLMAQKGGGINKAKTSIIKNAWPPYSGHRLRETNNRKKVILWAGRMIFLKNLYRLLDVFRDISDRGFELHLIGEGLEREKLESYIEKKSIKNVSFEKSVTHEELIKKMSSAAFLILPSFSDVGPNVISEAVGTKTPFIMTQESGYAEYFRELGILVDPFDKKDISRAIEVLMDDAKRKEYEDKLIKFSQLRTWEEAANDWVNLFKQIK